MKRAERTLEGLARSKPAMREFASYETADENGEIAALKTRPGARPFYPGLLPGPWIDDRSDGRLDFRGPGR